MQSPLLVVLGENFYLPGLDIDIIVAKQAAVEALMTLRVPAITNDIASTVPYQYDLMAVGGEHSAEQTHRHVVQPMEANGAEPLGFTDSDSSACSWSGLGRSGRR